MALGSHLITVRRLEKYINDVIGKKANLPDTSKTIIGNISQINSDLSKSITNQELGTLANNTDITINYDGVLVVNYATTGAQYGGISIIVNGVRVFAFGQLSPTNNAISGTFSYIVKNGDVVNIDVNTSAGTTATAKTYRVE